MDIVRADNWHQIVTDSPFHLGEKTVKGSWQDPSGTTEYYEVKFGTYPSIDGSTVAVPMAAEFARQHLGFSDEDAMYFASFNTTHQAYENLILRQPNYMSMIRSGITFLDETHPVDLLIVTEPSDDELALARMYGITLVTKPVCYDAFVFITHKDNPVTSLTADQIRDIYSGKITNWKDIGGRDEAIAAYQREENSGSQTAMENLVMQGTPMLPPETVKVILGMGALVETVAEYKNGEASIGYTYKFYIDNLYKNDDIKILDIDGISADDKSIMAELYPFTTRYYGVIRGGEENEAGGLFLDWMISAEGQKCIELAGYIPYSR